MEKYIIKYRNYLFLLKCISRFSPSSFSNSIATFIARYFSPRVAEQKKVSHSIKYYLGETVSTESAWNSYISHSSVKECNIFYHDRINKKWLEKHVEIQGFDYIQACMESEKSMLLMTYHHHYNLLLCILVGLLGYRTDVIAMNPKLNPLYESFKHMADKRYSDVESHLNGGAILYVEPGKFSTRSIVHALDHGHLVITANDFPDSFADKRRISLPFFRGTITCPTGSVEIGLRKGAHMASAFLRWLEKDKFQLVFEPIGGNTIDEIMRQYLAHLEALIITDPGLWEGWKALSQTETKSPDPINNS